MDRSFGAVVFTHFDSSRRYLLVLHAEGGHWDFPKGHPMPSETPEETVLREVFEETGCEIRFLPGFQDAIGYVLPSGEPKEVCYRLGQLNKPGVVCLPNREIRGLGWFSCEEARRILTFENSRGVLNRADAFLEGGESQVGCSP